MPDLPEPQRTALIEVGRHLRVDLSGARPLRLHDASTLLLPIPGLVVRLVTASDEALTRATTAVHLTGWLTAQGFPTTRPATSQPIRAAGHIATVWYAIPAQPDPDPVTAAAALGHLIRDLHTLPPTPIPTLTAAPLHRLRAALDTDTLRQHPVLTRDDHRFLTERINDLERQYQQMTFPLGVGLIHNDAHPGNLIPTSGSRHGFLLTDWESACTGPREMDLILVGAPGSRFDDADDERHAFTTAYGYDIARWPHHQTLRDIRDLHALAGHLRAAPYRPPARAELHHRIHTLRHNDRAARWHAI